MMGYREIENKISKSWDEMASAYDKFKSDTFSYSEMIEKPVVMRLLGDISGKAALDLGCGGGDYTVELARRGAKVVGVDISKVSLGIAHKKASMEGQDLELIMGSISDLGFLKGDRFDVVFSSTSMHYVADIENAFRQVRRLLKDGGMFVLSVVHPFYTAQYPLIDYAGADKYAVFQLRYFNHAIREYIPPWSKYIEEGDGRCISYHYTVDDYFNALKDAGFDIDRMVEPRPLPEWKEKYPRRYYEMYNYPLYLIFKCKK
ncbi:class I SAM-dependent methyltransferase [Methanooceanicella nereidis]|nr:class I SAM-dependent methyltransferase [Methanocella sp. CWC-04]